MIVKYATNGRNCVMGKTDTDACYPNVNVPELVYPNAHIADSISPSDLVPIDPNTLINKNMKKLQNSIVPEIQNATNGKDGEKPLNLPFGTQDAELDKFINAPYGNGLSPKFNNEYKQIQLRTLQKKMNAEAEEESKGGKPTGKATCMGYCNLHVVSVGVAVACGVEGAKFVANVGCVTCGVGVSLQRAATKHGSLWHYYANAASANGVANAA